MAPAVWYFTVHVDTPERLAQRRAISSLFIAEVDRDKVVLYGADEPAVG